MKLALARAAPLELSIANPTALRMHKLAAEGDASALAISQSKGTGSKGAMDSEHTSTA